LDLDVLALARLVVTVGFGQGAGVHGGELVHSSTFQSYKEGILMGPCGKCLNHAVLVMGYDVRRREN
jgi:hypothetical protein